MFHTDGLNQYSQVRVKVYSGNWSVLASQVYSPSSDQCVQLSRGEVEGTVYCLYPDAANQRIEYRYYDGASLGAATTLLTDGSVDDQPLSFSASYQPWEGRLAMAYVNGTNPFTMMHCSLPLDRAADSVVLVYDEGNSLTRSHYDGLNRLVTVERYSGDDLYSTESYSYGWNGLTGTHITPTGSVYSFGYDAAGNVIRSLNPDGNSSRTVIDYANNVRNVYDEAGRSRELAYDWVDRLVTVKEYNDTGTYYTTRYSYFGASGLGKVTDAKGRVTEYGYDQLGRQNRTDYADATYEELGYDDAGNVVWRLDQSGNYTYYAYDSLNRLTATSYESSGGGLSSWAHQLGFSVESSRVG